jgi:hypothetical protein
MTTEQLATIREARKQLEDMISLVREDDHEWDSRRDEFERRIVKAKKSLVCLIEALALLDAENKPSVPMEMLREIGEVAENDSYHSYQDEDGVAIAARFGYTVTESGKEEVK